MSLNGGPYTGYKTAVFLHFLRCKMLRYAGPKITGKRYWQLGRGVVGAEGVRCGEGVPSTLGKGSGEGQCPPAEKIFDFASQSGNF